MQPVVFHNCASESILRSIDKDHPDDGARLHSCENVRYEDGNVEPAGVKAPAMTAFHAPNAVGDPPHDRHIHTQFDYVQNNQECVPADESSCSLPIIEIVKKFATYSNYSFFNFCSSFLTKLS